MIGLKEVLEMSVHEYYKLNACELYDELKSEGKLHLLGDLHKNGFITWTTYSAVKKMEDYLHDNVTNKTGAISN